MGMEEKVAQLESRIGFAGGQIHALKVVLGAFITLSPSKSVLRGVFDSVEDVVLSQALSVAVSEDYLEGARMILSEMKQTLETD